MIRSLSCNRYFRGKEGGFIKIVNVFDIVGTEFPAGRKTRVIIGENGAIKHTEFAQGYVTIYPGGSVPSHEHKNIESYTILEGTGIMKVGKEEKK